MIIHVIINTQMINHKESEKTIHQPLKAQYYSLEMMSMSAEILPNSYHC